MNELKTKYSPVSIVKSSNCKYPHKESLFRPSKKYPEYPFLNDELSVEDNAIYESVREGFHLLKMDFENYGTEKWNPLKEYIKPGDTVLIKPNLVMETNHIEKEGVECLYTQPSVVAPVIDYVILALNGKGKIIIGDAPMQECQFDKLINESGYKALIGWYKSKGYDIELIDFRGLTSKVKNGIHLQEINNNARGKIVDLKENSEFFKDNVKIQENMRITNYDPRILKTHHNLKKHEYYISDYVLNADVIINMPKPKSHRKAGATISLKNFIGINVRKEFLPHHTKGSLVEGGDEYQEKSLVHTIYSNFLDRRNQAEADTQLYRAQFYRVCIRILAQLMKIRKYNFGEGSWYGNHTINKTIADLNKIVLYADKNGIMNTEPQRKIFIVADMIVSGEKEGPVAPSPKRVGIIAMGTNQVCFDEAICTLMGFDKDKIPTIQTARQVTGKYELVDASIQPIYVSNLKQYDGKKINELEKSDRLNFIPTSGWKGHIEI